MLAPMKQCGQQCLIRIEQIPSDVLICPVGVLIRTLDRIEGLSPMPLHLLLCSHKCGGIDSEDLEKRTNCGDDVTKKVVLPDAVLCSRELDPARASSIAATCSNIYIVQLPETTYVKASSEILLSFSKLSRATCCRNVWVCRMLKQLDLELR